MVSLFLHGLKARLQRQSLVRSDGREVALAGKSFLICFSQIRATLSAGLVATGLLVRPSLCSDLLRSIVRVEIVSCFVVLELDDVVINATTLSVEVLLSRARRR